MISDVVIRKRRWSERSDLGGEVVIVLNRVVRADLIEKVKNEQRLEEGMVSQVDVWGKSSPGRKKC